MSPGSGLSGQNFKGWNASATGNVNSWIGITGDISAGQRNISGVDLNVYNLLLGPTFAYNQAEHLNPFVYTLFAMALGGGLGLGLGRNFAVRVVRPTT